MIEPCLVLVSGWGAIDEERETTGMVKNSLQKNNEYFYFNKINNE